MRLKKMERVAVIYFKTEVTKYNFLSYISKCQTTKNRNMFCVT